MTEPKNGPSPISRSPRPQGNLSHQASTSTHSRCRIKQIPKANTTASLRGGSESLAKRESPSRLSETIIRFITADGCPTVR
jgi:hypothetical protein